MTDNIFSIRRFGNFFNLEINRQRNRLWLYFGVIVGILTLVALITSNNFKYDYANPDRHSIDPALLSIVNIYFVALFIFGALSASRMWAEMKNKQGRLSLLMNPATNFEKFLVKWLIYVLLFIAVFIFAVLIAETIRYTVFKLIYPQGNVLPLYLSGRYDSEQFYQIWDLSKSNTTHIFAITIIAYFTVQSFFVLGASIWTRNSFIKTFIAFGALTLSYILICVWLGNMVTVNKVGNPPEFFYRVREHSYLVFFLIAGTICLINWTLAYFRTREADIISTKI